MLDATLLEDSVTEALRLLHGEAPEDRTRAIERELVLVGLFQAVTLGRVSLV